MVKEKTLYNTRPLSIAASTAALGYAIGAGDDVGVVPTAAVFAGTFGAIGGLR